jgi:hypothetical protein
MLELQRQLDASGARAEELEALLLETKEEAKAWVRDAEGRAAAQLQRQQEESKSTISRHLEFIDRSVRRCGLFRLWRGQVIGLIRAIRVRNLLECRAETLYNPDPNTRQEP